MWLKSTAEQLDVKLRPVTTLIGKIGSFGIGVIVLLTVSDVVGRRLFGHPVIGTYEISEVMMAIVVFFTLGYTESQRRHVTIDLVVDRFPRRTRDILDGIMYIFYLYICCILTWQFFLSTLEAYRTQQLISTMLGVPVYPIIALSTLGSALFSLNVFNRFLLFLSGGLRK